MYVYNYIIKLYYCYIIIITFITIATTVMGRSEYIDSDFSYDIRLL